LTTLFVVAAREIYEQARSPLVWSLALVAAVLSAFSTHVAITRVTIAESRHQWLVELREQQRRAAAPLVHGTGHEPALRALRPPERLSILASGVDDLLPELWDFGPSGIRTGRATGDLGSAWLGAPAVLDLEMLIRLMVGLLAICLAIETIAGERASGALLALLGQPIRRRLILAGKLLGGTATLTAVVAVVGIVALTTTALTGGSFLSWDYFASLVMLCAAGAAYAAVCFAVGVLMAIRFEPYRLALIAAFVIWTLATLIAQPAADVFAQSVAGTQPQGLIEADRDRLVQTATADVQRRMGDEYAAALGGPATWTQHRNDPILIKTAQTRAEAVWDAFATNVRARLDQMSAEATTAAARHRRVAVLLSAPNPAVAFAAAAANLCGTGDRVADRWQHETDAYQRQLEQRVFDDRPNLYALVPYVGARQPGVERRLAVLLERHQPPTVEELGVVARPRRDLTQRLRDASPYLAALAFYLCVFVIVAMVAFDRLRL
jgi:ABC-type transport system involved in multi-copper enzyme maturation permease subunit